MLWVDQPIGTGFTTGTPTATTQEQTAQDFVKFFKNFEDIFGIKNYKIYVTGESYAGRYVPYVVLLQLARVYIDIVADTSRLQCSTRKTRNTSTFPAR
jgi:carboxypeptidase C (cathepsin A)